MPSTDAARAFLAQNTDTAASIAATTKPRRTELLDAVDQYAQHHAGGLFVLFDTLDPTDDRRLMVKMHDTWGDGVEDGKAGNIVVHVYDADGDGRLVEDGGTDVVTYYATADEALRAFMEA
jgi:hypothetical protein